MSDLEATFDAEVVARAALKAVVALFDAGFDLFFFLAPLRITPLFRNALVGRAPPV